LGGDLGHLTERAEVRALTSGDPESLSEAFLGTPWARPPDFFESLLAEHSQGSRTALVALLGSSLAGFTSIVWSSRYPHFRELGIPEIQDLNVVPALRRRGVATRLLDEAERQVEARSPRVGIGFGLHPGYRAAQQLYVRRGYVPDGRGVFYNGRYPEEGERVVLDDDLVLYLVKQLR